MRVLAFAASLRRGSLNRKLVELAADLARNECGCEVDLADYRDFSMPMYDGDLDADRGMPQGGLELKRRLERSEAVLLALPEYNYSLPGSLKNAIDWVSRARPIPFRGKSIYLMSASPSPMGGIRGLWQARIPLEGCGALVFPDMFALANAHTAFDEAGRIRDPALLERLQIEVTSFIKLVESFGGLWTAPNPDARARRRAIRAGIEDQTELQEEGAPADSGSTTEP
jgi:NAD(P)H-dependent FMN reductase